MKAFVLGSIAFCSLGAMLLSREESSDAAPPQNAPASLERVHLSPRFTPGQTLHYQMDYRSTTRGRRTGIVDDPSAPTQVDVTVSAEVKLEVLGVAADPSGRGQQVRIRCSYEMLSSTMRTDLLDPQTGENEAQRRNVQGHALEIILDGDGNVAKVEGLDNASIEERLAANAWLGLLSLAAGLPRAGIVPGQKWLSTQPWSAAAPLTGLTWRAESSYVRDEPCPASSLLPAGGPLPCAVILNRFQMLSPRKPRDQTPEDYRQRGLRTSGSANAAGESLTLISLQTGLATSVTQSSSEDVDVTVATLDGVSRLQFKSRVETQSNIRLLVEVPLGEKKPM